LHRTDKDQTENGYRLKLMRIHYKPRMLGEFVVEGAAAGVCGLGGPVDAAAGLLCGGGVHGLYERGGDALAAVLWGDDEVLQVAHVIQPRSAAVKQVVHEADQLLAFGGLQAGHEGMHGLIFVKKALPSRLRDLIGQGARAFTAIEGVVGIPERLPSGKVGGLDGANADVGWHGVGLLAMVFTMLLIALCVDSMPGRG
jgi:hypothetical protein